MQVATRIAARAIARGALIGNGRLLPTIGISGPQDLVAEFATSQLEILMGNIIAGVVIIGIGLAMGGSVFQGDFSPLSLFFDGLGAFWIGKGIYGMVKARGA